MCTSVLVNRPGEGFIFGLFTCDPIPYGTETLEADTLIATGITDEDGELTFSGEFPHGEYYVQELFADVYKRQQSRISPIPRMTCGRCSP